ncbi:CU044_5270 family protein [Streptomyces sp. NPDC059835]|uniref:CU044_5270 family protein n=1 Tax=Streptomyces sp. NPDC059835 TaxID=3346967 RepID=UPI00365F1EB6
MTERTTDILDFPEADRLRAAGEAAAPAPAVVEAALLAVRAAAAAEVGAPVGVAAPRRMRTRRLLVSAATIAAIAAGVSVYPVAGLKGSPPAATAGAADFLRRVAATEAKGTATNAPYWKVHTVQSHWGNPRNPEIERFETPMVRDGSLWLSADSVFHQEGADGEIVKTIGVRFQWSPALPDGSAEVLRWEDVKALPSDAAALKAALGRFHPASPGSDPEADRFLDYLGNLQSLLLFAPLEPRQRAAVYEVLADMPGLRLVGPVKDSTGRSGTAVEADTHNMRIRLVIDPEEGGLLESTSHYRGGEHDGMIAHRTTVLSAGPQQSIPPYREIPMKSERTAPDS